MVKPLILQGHDRPLSMVKFNREGDLLFTASKGKSKNCAVWIPETGERIGTFDGHAGAVFSVDINFNSTLLLTASADSSTRLWNIRTGKQLALFEHDTPAAFVNWAVGDKRFLVVTKGVMGHQPEISIYDLPDPNNIASKSPAFKIAGKSGITKAYWGPLNEFIYASHNDGTLSVYDVKDGELKESIEPHTKEISGFEFSKDKMFFVTGSKDKTAKIFDTKTLECLKTLVAGRPFSDVAISPDRPHIFIVGGLDAAAAATSGEDVSQYRARIYHSIYESEIGSIAGHFGPVNSIAVNPAGTLMVTGGEDGYIRVNQLDESYKQGLSDEKLFPLEIPEI